MSEQMTVRNDAIFTVVKAKPPNQSHSSKLCQKGFLDYQLGNAFPKEYDTWCDAHQLSYEMGRHHAASAASMDMDPDWFSHQLLDDVARVSCETTEQYNQFANHINYNSEFVCEGRKAAPDITVEIFSKKRRRK